MVALTSCSENEGGSQDIVEQMDIESEAALESSYEDVDLIVEAGMETVDTGGRIERDELLDCAVVTHDFDNNIITIDYGDGCEGPGGRIRAGMIIVTYNDHRLVPGAFRETTFDGFSIDSVLVEGTRRVENISEDLDDEPTFSITMTGGKLTFEDATTVTREAARTRTWFRGSNPLSDEVEVVGDASGTQRDGNSYTMEIAERLIFKRTCWARGVFIPVSGVKIFTSGEDVAVLDYGDGECDYLATVSINGEEPFEITLRPRRRFR